MCALASHLNVTQGAVSQHLRVMRDAGLVIDEKRGYYVHYRLNEQTLHRWREQIDGLLTPGSAEKCRCPKRACRESWKLNMRKFSKEDLNMCCCNKTKGCQKPENLKSKPQDCPPEQVHKCHGGVKKHPCTAKEKQ